MWYRTILGISFSFIGDRIKMKKEQRRKQQSVLVERIDELCKEKNYSYYALSYKSSVPLTTLIHIMDGTSKNPGVFTVIKICDGLGVSLSEFFNTEAFNEMLKEVDG